MPAIIQMQKRGTPLRDEDIEPAIPPGGMRFIELHQLIRSRLAPGMLGLAPITWRDFEAYVNVTGNQLSESAVLLIGAIDDVFLKAAAKSNE